MIEIGTYISMCPHPYAKTKVVKFLPRYIVINKLDLPLVIKAENAKHQIALTQDEEIYYNIGKADEDKIMIRLINIQEEAKITHRVGEEKHREEFRINLNALSSKQSRGSVVEENKQIQDNESIPSRRDADPDELDEDES